MTRSPLSEYQRPASESMQAWLTPGSVWLPAGNWVSNSLDVAGATRGRWSNTVTSPVWAKLGRVCHPVMWTSQLCPKISYRPICPTRTPSSTLGVISVTIRAPVLSSAQCQSIPAEQGGQSSCDSYKVAEGTVYFSWSASNERAANSNKSQLCNAATFPLWWKPFSLVFPLYISSSLLDIHSLLWYSFNTAPSYRHEVSFQFGNLRRHVVSAAVHVPMRVWVCVMCTADLSELRAYLYGCQAAPWLRCTQHWRTSLSCAAGQDDMWIAAAEKALLKWRQ